MGEAVALASRLRPTWPCMHEMSLWLGRRLPGGADAAIGMNKGGTFEAAGIKVTMTHADHSAGDWNPGGETTLYLGDPAGFVVELENGFRFYHAGDTTPFGDMRLIRDLYRPEFAMLPIGGHYTMDPRAAALAVGAARRQARHAAPLRHVPDPGRDARGLADRAGRPRPDRRRDPRARAGRQRQLIRRRPKSGGLAAADPDVLDAFGEGEVAERVAAVDDGRSHGNRPASIPAMSGPRSG